MEQKPTATLPTCEDQDFEVDGRMLRFHNGNAITCPNCGWEYTRPVAVEVRTGEGGKMVRVDLETGEVSFHPEFHASCCRRQVLTVQVECEKCVAVGDPAARLEVQGGTGEHGAGMGGAGRPAVGPAQ